MGGGGSSKKKSSSSSSSNNNQTTTPTANNAGGLINGGPLAFPGSMNRAQVAPVIPDYLQQQLAMAFSPQYLSQIMQPVQSIQSLVPHLGVALSGASLKPPSSSPLFPASGAATIAIDEKKDKK